MWCNEITSENDCNNDHRIVFRSTMMATRPTSKHTVDEIFSFEIFFVFFAIDNGKWTPEPPNSIPKRPKKHRPCPRAFEKYKFVQNKSRNHNGILISSLFFEVPARFGR